MSKRIVLLKVYVAGALEDNATGYVRNMHRMITWSEKIRKMKCAVFVPCLSLLQGLVHGDWDYEDYFKNDQPFLECCDVLFLIPGWENSNGVKREKKRAEQLGIPVFANLDQLRHHIAVRYREMEMVAA